MVCTWPRNTMLEPFGKSGRAWSMILVICRRDIAEIRPFYGPVDIDGGGGVVVGHDRRRDAAVYIGNARQDLAARPRRLTLRLRPTGCFQIIETSNRYCGVCVAT